MGELQDKAKGKFKEIKGTVTGDKSEKRKGKALQARGAAKGKIADIEATVRDAAYGDSPDAGPTVDRETMAPSR